VALADAVFAFNMTANVNYNGGIFLSTHWQSQNYTCALLILPEKNHVVFMSYAVKMAEYHIKSLPILKNYSYTLRRIKKKPANLCNLFLVLQYIENMKTRR